MSLPRFDTCDLLPLDRLFDSGNTPHEEELAAHVTTCSSCRQKMESLAADDCWWQEATQFLTREEYTQADAQSVALPTSDTSFLQSSNREDAIGSLGEYDILELIGRGGNGIVFKGYQASLNRFVAVKVLAPHLDHSAAARQRFQREAEAAAAVIHEHVIAIHAIEATDDGLPYLVMPLVLGGSLQRRLDRQGPLPLRDMLRIGRQTAAGLAAAHAHGLVHRDIKPANILLDGAASRVLITDFGLARAADDASLTCSGVIAGTPHYMSPEQVEASTIDSRTDLFSLGSVLYAMATGHPPFRAELTMAVLRRICEDAPRSVRESNSELPDWFAAIVGKLLAKSPNDRFASAQEVDDLLAGCLHHVQQPAAIPLPQEATRLIRAARPKRLSGWKTTVLTMTVAMVFAGWWFRPTGAPEAASPDAVPNTVETLAQDTPAMPQPTAARRETVWDDGLGSEIQAIRATLDQWEPIAPTH